jgi:CRP-like cAMP-binding protein
MVSLQEPVWAGKFPATAQNKISTRKAPAYTLFYIQEGGVRLTTRSKHQPSAVTAILGVQDFFGELCLAGYPLARTLLLLARYGAQSQPQNVLPKISQEMLAEMIGTTRPRVNFFMNKFRKLGFIKYNGEIRVNNSLLSVVLHE